MFKPGDEVVLVLGFEKTEQVPRSPGRRDPTETAPPANFRMVTK